MKFTQKDIEYMVSESVNRILKENNVDELIAYHGSAANFDNFDLSFIGTGEGTQAYGYGVYVSGVFDTGKMYAVIATYENKNRNHGSQDWRAKSLKKYRRYVNVLKWCFGKVKGSMKNKPELYIPYTISQFIDKKWFNDNELINIIKGIKTQSDFYDLLTKFKELATRSFCRFLYTLDIPETGYIDWNNTDIDFIRDIHKKLSKVFDTSHVNLKKVKTFGDLYSQLRGWKALKDEKTKSIISQKDISFALYNLGFKGIKVPTGQSHGGDGRGMNYVIFNPKDIKIIKKEKF